MEERSIIFHNKPIAVLDGGTGSGKLLKARQASVEGGGMDGTKPRIVDQVNANLQQRAAEREANMSKSATTKKGFQPPEWTKERADKYRPNPDAPKSPVAQWGEQKRAEFEENHPGFSPGKAFLGAVEKGVQDTAQAFIDTLAFGEDLLWSPVEFLNDFEPGTISDDAIFNKWAEKMRENGEKIDAKHGENIEAGGNTGKFIYNVGSATVQAIPQTVVALLAGGASAAAQTTAGLQSVANAALSPGVVSTVETIVGNMARDPQYWLAFSQNVGGSYQSAVEMLEEQSLSDEISGRGDAMSSGEIQTKAALYALGIGLIGAAIERSGGIQTLPDELRHGGDYWKMIVDSSVDEGKEEIVQGILDRANQNLILGQKMPLVSLTDRNAVLSLPAAAEEFGTGAFVGGVLSGGQVAAHGIGVQAQSHAKLVAEGYAKLRSGEMPNAAQLNAMGLNEPDARGKMVLFKMENMDDVVAEEELPEGYSVALNVGRSVGAKAKSYVAYNPLSGEEMPLTEGTRIIQPKNHIMAGKGRDRQIDEIQLLLDTYGGDPLEWTKEKGFGYVDDEYGESHYVELHWYQEPSIGQVKMKIKVQPDGRIYLDED